jgi:hypothetical protein
MKSRHPLRIGLACLVTTPALFAQESSPVPEILRDWNIGGVIFPNVHLHGTAGTSSGKPENLANGAHDPRRSAISAQAIEPGVSLRTQYVEGFANYLFYQDAHGDWDGELEEAFGKLVNLPGGFEAKAGRFLPRYGAMNHQHLHAWDFVDAETATTRFLGDDGLLLEGAEVSWTLPLGMDPTFTSVISAGFGNAPAHDHEHHEHGGAEPNHEAEGALPNDDIATLRWMARFRFDDFHSITVGTSYADGNNQLHRDTQVQSIDVEYHWRENGLESGGSAFRWRNEYLWREFGAHSEHDEDGDGVINTALGDEIFDDTLREKGFYSHAIYSWNPRFDTGLRVGWVEGCHGVGLDETIRISPAVTWWLDDARSIGLRTQYNLDSVRGSDDDQSIWFQLNISLGSGEEVR